MKSLLGLVQIEKAAVLEACEAHIASKTKQMQKDVNEAIEKRQEKARKGLTFFRVFYLIKPKELTRAEVVQQFKDEKNGWGASKWDLLTKYGKPGHSDAYSTRDAALNCKEDHMFISLEHWSWLVSWLPDSSGD